MKTEKLFLEKILKDTDTIVFACSGGPDSMCLLNLLYQFQNKKNLTLVCAHVNHNVRKESEEEYLFVKEYCEQRKIIFEGLKLEKISKNNFHNDAHQKRRDFFEKIVEKYQAQYLMTAHHGDDLIETILMRLTRGTSLNGYKGFSKIQQEKNYQIIRPLITTTKKEIEEYDKLNKIPYVIDESNNKDKYTRNRYRHYILPFLKKENKNVHQKFLQFNEEICRINEFLVKFTKNALTDCLENDNLLIVELKKLDLLIQQEVLKEYLYQIYQNDIVYLNEKHLKSLLQLINNEKSSGKISLPKNKVAIKTYQYFKIEDDIRKNDYCIELKEEFVFLSKRIQKIKDTTEKNNFVIRLNSQEISLPLYVRNRKENDKIQGKNMVGHQKIKKIFIDYKIPIDLRDSYPIITDAKNEIIWVPGLKKSKFDKEIDEKYDIIYKYFK